MTKVLMYLSLGFEVFNAVTTLVALFRMPALLSPEMVWTAIMPVLNAIQTALGVSINMTKARAIATSAVAAIQAVEAPATAK